MLDVPAVALRAAGAEHCPWLVADLVALGVVLGWDGKTSDWLRKTLQPLRFVQQARNTVCGWLLFEYELVLSLPSLVIYLVATGNTIRLAHAQKNVWRGCDQIVIKL